MTIPHLDIFERLESRVRSYSRTFPVVFDSAQGPYQTDVSGRRYIDFFCGAGALNYGHNEPRMKQALLDYIAADGVMHSLDMATRAKARFLERFEQVILAPRRMNYRVQFTGPTGANAVEAALKLARKVTGRTQVIAFTRAYHGLSAGALAATANSYYREPHSVQRGNVTFMPYDGYFGPSVDTTDYLARLLGDEASGIDLPAAVIVETIQAEGGINVASAEWLRKLQAICRRHEILLIVDDIQTGCGRTGSFFSFEAAGIEPDLVVLSKSISGYGFPMSLVLIKPAIDLWKTGEHTGTFRGNNAAFVTAAAALSFWESQDLEHSIARTHDVIKGSLARLSAAHPQLGITVRGHGLLIGFETSDPETNRRIARECFEQGLIAETCGGSRNVIKLMPPLNIPADVAETAMAILSSSVVSAAALATA
jgi:diaminobutyrate-2-oxoglutarate transaminase